MDISVFGKYAGAKAMVALVAKRNEKLQTPIYREFLDWDTPQISLSYKNVIGNERIAAMAAVHSSGGTAPLRERIGLQVYEGKIPYISHKYAMDEDKLREYLTLRDSSMITPEAAKQMTLNFIFDDVKLAVDGVENRIDFIFLRMISTAKIDLTTSTNPDGVALGRLSILPKAENIITPKVYWNDLEKATGIKDIQDAVNDIEAEIGSRPEVIFMNNYTLSLLLNQKSTADYFKKLGQAAALMDLTKLNEFLTINKLPAVRVLNKKFKVQGTQGKSTKVDGFVNGAVTFAFAGKLGKVKNAINIQATRQSVNGSQGVYANVKDGIWIQKFSPEAEEMVEYTKGQAIAMPSLDGLDSIFFFNALEGVITIADEKTEVEGIEADTDVDAGDEE